MPPSDNKCWWKTRLVFILESWSFEIHDLFMQAAYREKSQYMRVSFTYIEIVDKNRVYPSTALSLRPEPLGNIACLNSWFQGRQLYSWHNASTFPFAGRRLNLKGWYLLWSGLYGAGSIRFRSPRKEKGERWHDYVDFVFGNGFRSVEFVESSYVCVLSLSGV